MLFHRDFPIQIIVGNVPSLRKDKKRTTIVKTIVFFSRCLLRKLGSTWYHCTMDDFALFQIKNSRESEEPIEAMEQIFSALGAHRKRSVFSRLFGPKQPAKYFSFEIVAAGGTIHFLFGCPRTLVSSVESQLVAQYPKLSVVLVADYVPGWLKLPFTLGQCVFTSPSYIGLRTYKDVRDIDLLSGLLGHMSKLSPDQAVGVQLRISPAGDSWGAAGRNAITRGIVDPANPQRTKSHPQARLIEAKISQVGFTGGVRIMTVAKTDAEAQTLLHTIAGSLNVFSSGEGNALSLEEPNRFQRDAMIRGYRERSSSLVPRYQYFGSSELASLWHPPGLLLSSIKSIAWGGNLFGEAPENLPVATGSEDADKEINFIAKTDFKNAPTTFGVKRADRRKHLYIIGKTGAGKSTMIANMAINDMRNGEGMCIIDPHGDLTDTVLSFVPSYRINDVAYLDPSDIDHPFHLNPLEVKNDALRELVASGIVSIFYKLYHYSWGPRLEYILRNTILTLLQTQGATLLGIPELLTNDSYRRKIVEKMSDPVLKNFWINEFDKLSPQMKSESIMPILNKVGQFLSSRTIRNIVGSPTSTIDFEEMMDQGKIIIVNLSQGKLGEDNSALLGAMLITKIQLAAMNRVYQEEGDRRDFYLYVDEFQNFATTSFIKILSEARKYRLCLTLANQYIGQIDEDVQGAIFGNVGSLISFAVGASDARPLSREFGGKYKEEELVRLGNYQIILRLSINNETSDPFAATTLPLPRSKNQNREKIIRSSRERFTKPTRETSPEAQP